MRLGRHSFIVNAPFSKIGVVLRSKGEIKSRIESAYAASIEINVNSSTGNIECSFESDGSELELAEKLREVLNAITLGFEPKKALNLIRDDIQLKIYYIRDLMPLKHAKHTRLVRARIIGSKGTARERIEELSGTALLVDGHIVAIMGKAEDVAAAHHAVEMLAEGKAHRRAFGYLGRFSSEARKRRLLRKYRPVIEEDEDEEVEDDA